MSEGLASCSIHSRLLFIGLWCMADRSGRLEDRPLRIKAELFPYDNCDIEAMLEELAGKKDCDGTPSFILRYGDKKRYIQIVNFLKHQTPHIKEQASIIPAPDMHGASTSETHLIPDSGFLIADTGYLNPDSIYSQVLGYLNQKTGAKFKPVESNKKHIRARVNEGYLMPDFQVVIDKKVSEWTGTDQQKYLRPETLFGPKFDGYLNQQEKQKPLSFTDKCAQVAQEGA